MGIDSIKSKVAGMVNAAKEAVTAKEATPAPAPPETKAQPPSEGYDSAKKKLVSVSGTHRAHAPVTTNTRLKEMVDSARVGGAIERPGLFHGGLDSASKKGADPAPRKPEHDFAAQAKKALPKGTPSQIEAKAAELAKNKLEKDFGVKVKNGDKEWKAEELTRAYESFSSMPKGDREKLKGLDLIRNAKASPEDQAAMDKAGGGTIGGIYQPNVKTNNGTRDRNGAIELYDEGLKGSRKDSLHLITHEAGHAVEGRKTDDATFAYNVANDKAKAAGKNFKAANDENNGAINGLNAAGKKFGRVSGKDKEGYAFLKAQKGVDLANQKLGNAKTPEAKAKAETELTAAKAKRDTALAGMSGHKKEDKAKDVVAASDAHEKTSRARADAGLKLQSAKDVQTEKMKEWKSVATVTVGKVGGKKGYVSKSNELAAFEKARGKEKPVSPYGASKGAEGFAEAYALYQRDPKYMQDKYPNQYQYFHDHHRSARD